MIPNGFIAIVPQITPESCDPMGSTRHTCYIVDLKFKTACGEYKVDFISNHIEDGVFIVHEYSPEFTNTCSIQEGFGVVLKELNDNYSWWFNDLSK